MNKNGNKNNIKRNSYNKNFMISRNLNGLFPSLTHNTSTTYTCNMRVIIGVTHWPISFVHSANKRIKYTHTHIHFTRMAKLYIQIGLYCVKVSPKNSKRQWHPQSCHKSSVLNDYNFFFLYFAH